MHNEQYLFYIIYIKLKYKHYTLILLKSIPSSLFSADSYALS